MYYQEKLVTKVARIISYIPFAALYYAVTLLTGTLALWWVVAPLLIIQLIAFVVYLKTRD